VEGLSAFALVDPSAPIILVEVAPSCFPRRKEVEEEEEEEARR
jgi:hypothetical protein